MHLCRRKRISHGFGSPWAPGTRQIMAFHVGDRRRDSAKELWAKIPLVYREQAIFHTDQYDAYTSVIPAERHHAITKHAQNSNRSECFNNTLTRCGSASLVWSAKRCRSPRNWPITSVR